MAQVSINGKKAAIYNAIGNFSQLIDKLYGQALKTGGAITHLWLNQIPMDLDSDLSSIDQITYEDKIEVSIDSPQRLSIESLDMSLEFSKLLLFDVKLAIIDLWEGKNTTQVLKTLLIDSDLFLSLASRAVSLMGKNPKELNLDSQKSLESLDFLGTTLEEAIQCSIIDPKVAAEVLGTQTLPILENWPQAADVLFRDLNLHQS